MNKQPHSIGFITKKHVGIAAICLAFGVPALAQTGGTPPPLPGINMAAGAPGLPDLPAPTSGDAPALPAALSPLPSLPIGNATASAPIAAPAADTKTPADATKTADAGKKPAGPLADLPAPAPESTEQATTANTAPLPLPTLPIKTASTEAVPALPSIPGLPAIPAPPASGKAEPTASVMPVAPPGLALPVPSIGGLPGVTALPEVSVTSAKPKRTWDTVLAPAIEPKRTNFRYKREILPSVIYSNHYTEQNEHLPIAQSRQDYEKWLFQSVSKNDVEVTRALLNAGTDINSRDGNGNTPLAVARLSNAPATAQLLIARGGR